MKLLPLDSPLFPSGFKFLVPFFENIFVPAVQFVRRGDVADGAVEPNGVVSRDILCHKSPGIVKRKRRLRANAFSFERLVKTFQFAVRLRIIGRCSYMGHPGQSDEFLEVLGNELWSVVRDDPGPCFRILLLGPLDDDFYVRFQHPLPDLPVDDEAAASVKKAAQIVKRTTDVDIRYVHMPVLVRQKRLDKACALFADFLVPLIQKPGLRKNTPGAGRAYSNDILVQHHEREPPVAFQRVIVIKSDDGLPFPVFQPEIPRNGGIMLIGFAVPIDPCMKFALADRKPADEPLDRNAGFIVPGPGKVNYGVSGIMGNPDAG
jgi:hypothetical protein